MIRTLLVHEVRLMCAVLAAVLNNEADFRVVGLATNIDEALAYIADCDIVLVRATYPDDGALSLIRNLVKTNASAKIVVLGLAESESAVMPYIEAGASGYVLAEGSVDELFTTIRAVYNGTVRLSPEMAAALMARVAELAEICKASGTTLFPPPDAPPELTLREREVLELIAHNLNNQDIAGRLAIELGTVKNHVHNILKKLNVSSREEAAAYLAAITTN